MEKIYFATIDNDVIDNFAVSRLALMHDAVRIRHDDVDTLRSYVTVCDGIIREIKNPSIEYLLRNGHKVSAIKVYRDKHPNKSLLDIRNAINRIEEKMKNRESVIKKFEKES